MKTNLVKTLIATAIITMSFGFVVNTNAATSDYVNAGASITVGPKNATQFEAVLNKNVDISAPLSAETGYWYTQLETEEEKTLYKEMTNKLANGYFVISYDQFSVDLNAMGQLVIEDVFKSVRLDHPEMYYLSAINYNAKDSTWLGGVVDTDAIVIKNKNLVNAANGLNAWVNLENQMNELNTALTNFGDPFGIEDGDSELTIVDKIATWTNNNCNYTYANEYTGDTYFTNQIAVHTMYGAVTSGQVLCEGYSHFMQYYLTKHGITATKHGNAVGSHIWNMVQVDGNWYELDTTGFYEKESCFFTTEELQSMDESFIGYNNADGFKGYMPTATTDTTIVTRNGQLYFAANAPEETTPKVLGDVSKNNTLDLVDLVMLAAHLRGTENIPYALEYADADNNGMITISDLAILMSMLRAGQTNVAI